MLKFWFSSSIVTTTLLIVGLSATVATAQVSFYHPIGLTVGSQIQDTLSDRDIPTGQGGFARDYVVSLKAGDQVTIALSSKSFDTYVSLINADGIVVGENDDGPDGSTNSVLVVRVPKSGVYTVRVQPSGKTRGFGPFILKVTRQRPAVRK